VQPAPTIPDLSRYRLALALGLFFLALAVRLVGIGWGLKNDLHNQSYHPDEEVNWRASRAIEPLKLSFTPGFYSYGTLYLSTLRLASDFGGVFAPAQGEPATDWAYIARGEVAGRLVSAVAGAGLVATLFWVGSSLFGAFGGLMAGLAVAFAPGLVMHSRFATVDVFGVFWIGLAMLAAVRLLSVGGEKSLWKWTLAAGAFSGLAAGTKYTGGLAVVMALVALGWRRPVGWVTQAGVAVLTTIGVFVLSTPGILLDKEAFWRDFKFEQAHVASGHGLVFVDTAPGFLYHWTNLFLVVSVVTVLLGLGGLVWGAVRREGWAFVVGSFFLLYFLVIGGAAVKFARYCFPLVPALALGAGYSVAEGLKMGRKGAWLVGAGMLGLAGIPGQGGMVGTVTVTSQMVGADPRDVAARALKEAADAATTVGLPEDPWFWSPPLFPDSTMVRMIPFRVRDELRRAATQPSVLQFVPENPNERSAWDSRLLSQLKPTYVAYSDLESFDLERLHGTKVELPEDQTQTSAQFETFMSELKAEYEQWKTIGPNSPLVEDLRYICPTVYLWKRK
jgi:hypothetical protein